MPIIVSKNIHEAFYVDINILSQITRLDSFNLGDWTNDMIVFEDGTMSRFEPANSVGLWQSPIQTNIKSVLDEISKVDISFTDQQFNIETWDELFKKIKEHPVDIEFHPTKKTR